MIEVTEEMRDLVVNWRSKSPSPYFALEHTIQALIELHEANKPKPDPVAYKICNPAGCVLVESKRQAEKLASEYGDGTYQPLYTNPPTREPLSEEEIEKLVPWQGDPKDPFFNRIKFARLVEQAHGIT